MGTGDWVFIAAVCAAPLPLLGLLVKELVSACSKTRPAAIEVGTFKDKAENFQELARACGG